MRPKLWQLYHLEPPAGLLNDPNGLAFFDGAYYVFFQWNKFEKNHSYKEWGSFTSSDLLHWRFNGSALLPDQPYDQHGVYSGSAFVKDNALYLCYTGNHKEDGRRTSRQCIAVTQDGRRYLKLGPVLDKPEGYTPHFRDPDVFQGENGEYFMLIGAQRVNGRGALALARSRDGLSWQYERVFAYSEQYEMIECPDLFRLDGQYILLYCPQSRDRETDITTFSYSGYKPVGFDEAAGTISPADADLDHDCIPMDHGFDFYSPQTLEDNRGRRILFAWMSRMEQADEDVFSAGEPAIHCLTMPRVLHWRNRCLLQQPPDEFYQMLGGPIEADQLTSRAFHLAIRDLPGLHPFRLTLHGGEASVTFDPASRVLTLSRLSWMTGRPEYKTCKLDALHALELWSDYSSIEIFVNEGSTVLSSRIYPSSETLGIDIEGADGCSTILRPIHK